MRLSNKRTEQHSVPCSGGPRSQKDGIVHGCVWMCLHWWGRSKPTRNPSFVYSFCLYIHCYSDRAARVFGGFNNSCKGGDPRWMSSYAIFTRTYWNEVFVVVLTSPQKPKLARKSATAKFARSFLQFPKPSQLLQFLKLIKHRYIAKILLQNCLSYQKIAKIARNR